MSLISSYIRNELLKQLQEEYNSHSDEIKEKAIEELQNFAEELMGWVKSKLTEKSA